MSGPGSVERLGAWLHRRLDAGPILVAPGAYDALTARLVEQAGFEAVYLSGAGLSYSLLGRRDIGLLTMSEMAERLAYVTAAVGVPVIADADTGYGGDENVARTVRAYARAGAAALQIEDQEWPKRCGHLEGKRLVPAEEMAARIRAARGARGPGGPLIIARTDARAIEGLTPAIERARRYKEAGADVLFVEAPESEQELTEIGRALPGPLMTNMVEGGRTPLVEAHRLEAWGFRLVIFPNSLLRLFARQGQSLLRDLRDAGTTAGSLDRMMLFKELNDLLEFGRARRRAGA